MHYFYNNTITEINFTQKSKFGTFYGYQTHLKKTMLHISFYCLTEKLFVIYGSEFMVITRDSKDLNLLF